MISNRIQRARLLRGLSLEALAQCMGDISKQALSKFEKGDALPNSTRILQLAKALNVKPEYFSGLTRLNSRRSISASSFLQQPIPAVENANPLAMNE